MYPSYYGNNPLFPSKKDFQVIKKDEISGLGVITFKHHLKGEIVAAFAGELTEVITQHSLQIDTGKHLLDSYFTGFLLHSCSPNVELDMKKMLIYAVSDIEPNTFLYMDYAQTEDILFKQFPCSCGSKNCRGWITGRLETPDYNMMKEYNLIQPEAMYG